MSINALNEKIEKQLEKLNQLKAQKQAIEAREKKKISEQQRKEEKFEDIYRLKKQMELVRERIWAVYGYGDAVFLEEKIGFVNDDIVRNRRTICLSYYPVYCY